LNKYFKAIKNDESIPDELKKDADYFINETEGLTAEQLQVIAGGMYSLLKPQNKLQALKMTKLFEGDQDDD